VVEVAAVAAEAVPSRTNGDDDVAGVKPARR